MHSGDTRDLTSYISAYAPFMGVLATIGVAFMQYFLQRQQLKQNLFDKRFKVFRAVEEYLTSVVVDDDDVDRKGRSYVHLVMQTRDAEFLFGPEVVKFIDDAKTLDATLRSVRSHREGDEWAEAMLKAVNSVQVDIVDVFSPYLQLHNNRSWLARLKARVDDWIDSTDLHYDSRS